MIDQTYTNSTPNLINHHYSLFVTLPYTTIIISSTAPTLTLSPLDLWTDPQGTVLGPLLFLIMVSDIDKDVSASKLVSFADNTRLYSGVGDVADCDKLQLDLNAVVYMIFYWASSNNMFFNSKKFSYVCFSSNVSTYKSNLYIDPAMNIIGPSTHVQQLYVGLFTSLIFGPPPLARVMYVG